MGYFVEGKKIAKINPKADVVSLSANPNFVLFESEIANGDWTETGYFEMNLYLNQFAILFNPYYQDKANHREKSGAAGFVIGNEAMVYKREYRIRVDVNEEGRLNETYENDVILYKSDLSYGVQSLTNRLQKDVFLNEFYDITAFDGYVNIKAKNKGAEYVIKIFRSYFIRTTWYSFINDVRKIVKMDTNLIFNTNIHDKGGKSYANLPTYLVLEVNSDKGYDFVGVDKNAIGEGIIPIPLNRDESLELMKKYIQNSSIRINPYTSYFEDIDFGCYKLINYTRFSIKSNNTGVSYWFQGVDPIMELSGAYETSDYTYQLSDDPVLTAQNLKEALLKCPFIRDNFKVSESVELLANSNEIRQKPIINIESSQLGMRYNFDINIYQEDKTEDEDYKEHLVRFKDFMSIAQSDYNSMSLDTINEGAEACEIHLDLYANTGVFLGEADSPNIDDLGTYVTTLTKSYSNQPVWFDLNAIQTKKYQPPFGLIDADSGLKKSDCGVWFDAATYSDRRFVAKRVTTSASESFYYSPVLYTLTGFDRNLNANDLKKYVFDVSDASTIQNELIHPLTLQPEVSHVKGQMQYFNFILKDNLHSDNDSLIGIEYELLTQSGAPIGEPIVDHQLACSKLNVVNTIALDIDRYVDQYPNLGMVRARLALNGVAVSHPMTINVLPSYLYRVHDFVFLNSLGGWSSFNFADQDQLDYKATATSFFRNQTPSSNISSSIETVYTKTVDERFTVRTQPISLAMAEWLKEMGASIAVYERTTERYVIVDELNVKYTSQDSFVRLEMKYRYSDSFNSQTK